MAIGKLFHIIHMTGQLNELEAWYDDVFGVKVFMPHSYMPSERRDASLVLLGDCVIEPLAPAFSEPDWAEYPLGRFYGRFGNHWHSIAFYADDTVELWRTTQKLGLRTYGEGGKALTEEPVWDAEHPNTSVFTHPKETFTQLEFFDPRFTNMYEQDFRNQPDWDGDWWINNHPIKTPGLAYTTLIARDLDRAEDVYVNGLGGTLLHKGTSDLTMTQDTYVQLGDTVIQLSKPLEDGTLAAADAEKFGDSHHAAAFRVQNIDDTEAYLNSKGVATLARDEETLLTDPATTFGVPFRWTTWDVPGGPRDTK
jgi:catechol 2,3-dioxygenase-like lactoylglutathione lyase family enzyme